MPFPTNPTDQQSHQEGGQTFIFELSRNTWRVEDQSGAGSTNLSFANRTATQGDIVSSTGTDATVLAASATEAGFMTAAQFSKLDGVEPGATADQNAADVPVTPSGNLASSDVQAALAELQGDIDNLTASGAADNYIASSASPTAGLGVDGDFHLNVVTGAVTGPKAGGAWPADGNAGNSFSQIGLDDAIEVDTVVGAGGTATTAARSDHSHAESVGATLPATGNTSPQIHHLRGDAVLPDGEYAQVNGNQWKQIG